MVVVTVGCFDLLHQGHINLFRSMALHGDSLTVLVHDDASIFANKGKFPVQTLEHRLRNIELTRLVDCALPVMTADPTPALQGYWRHTKEFVFVRGDDWHEFPGRAFLDEIGIPIHFVQYTHGVSSTVLRDKL